MVLVWSSILGLGAYMHCEARRFWLFKLIVRSYIKDKNKLQDIKDENKLQENHT